MSDAARERTDPSVVLGHDWLIGMRGGERVLEIFCDMFPQAHILTLIHDPAAVSEAINAHTITASALQRVYDAGIRYRTLLPLFPMIVRGLKTPAADILLTSSHCVVKGLRRPPGGKHICYCFTPMRYAWTFYDEYFGTNPLKAMIVKPILAALRSWDRRASARVDRFVAISKHVQKRIKDFYGRESDIVYPPVDTGRCTPGTPPSADYDLIVSALVPYKRVDLAVRAYARVGYPLKVVGTGSQLDTLRANAAGNVEFLGWQSDDAVLDLYRNCRMLVFPGEEDFGIVPLEAQACGRPVVAYARGGALETVERDVSGVFFEQQTEDSLAAAVTTCADTRWDSTAIRANAERFSIPKFREGIRRVVADVL